VRETLAELAQDTSIAAVRVGMLGSAPVASAVADFLEQRRFANVVVDPILKSSSGADLIDEDGVEILRIRLFKVATIITPNIGEAAALTGSKIENLDAMRLATERLHVLGAENVVITGGHLQEPLDLLSIHCGEQVQEFRRQHLASTSTHGTGCAFATALACSLAVGKTMNEAVQLAGDYVYEAIAHAPKVGTGHGPIHHLFRCDQG
jgi:hydroxymethylpyrimidine kinase/phosphomethylpyrimidine kinase